MPGSNEATADSVAEPGDPVRRWKLRDLIALVPNSSRKVWLVDWVPHCIATGALRKVGQSWLGRRSAIEAALLSEVQA